MFCPYCGKGFEDGSSFCPYCGKSLDFDIPQAPVEDAVVEIPGAGETVETADTVVEIPEVSATTVEDTVVEIPEMSETIEAADTVVEVPVAPAAPVTPTAPVMPVTPVVPVTYVTSAMPAEPVVSQAPQQTCEAPVTAGIKELPLAKQKKSFKEIIGGGKKDKGEGSKPRSGKKKVALIVVALILVIGIVIGSVIMSAPTVAVSKAAKKTVLDSSSFEFEYSVNGSKYMEGKVDFGRNYEESGLYLKNSYGYEMGYFNGEIKNTYSDGDIDDMFESIENLFDYYGIDIDVDPEETLNRLIKNEIREEELLKIYDEQKEAFEEMIADFTDEEIVLPDSDELKSMISGYLSDMPEGVIEVEKESKSGKKIYEYEVDVEEFLVGLVEYASSKSKYSEYFGYLDDVTNMDADDLIDIIKDIGFADIEGKIVIEKGYISEFAVDIFGNEYSVEFSNVNDTVVDEEVLDDIEQESYDDEDYYSDEDYYY